MSKKTVISVLYLLAFLLTGVAMGKFPDIVSVIFLAIVAGLILIVTLVVDIWG